MPTKNPASPNIDLMDLIFLVDECLELGVLWKRANPALKKICWQITTEQVHSFKSITQRKKQMHIQ